MRQGRFTGVLAANTAGIAAESTLRSAAGINAKTARAYQALFQRMLVLDLVPAWFPNKIKRLIKRYLADPALVAAVPGFGREAGLLIETAGGQLIGIEIKAAATVTGSGARHLAWLRDEAGDAFAAGIILHAGPHAFPVNARVIAAPVSSLWS